MRDKRIPILCVAVLLLVSLKTGAESAAPAYGSSPYRPDELIELTDSILKMDIPQIKSESMKLFKWGEENKEPLAALYGSALLGFSYLMDPDLDSALFYLYNAVNISERHRSSSYEREYDFITSYAYNSLALYYLNYRFDYYKAQEYLYIALKDITQEVRWYPVILANLTLTHYFREDTSGMEYAKRLMEISDETPKSMFLANYGMASMQLISERGDSALIHCNNAIDALEKDGVDKHKRELIMAYNLKGKILLHENKSSEALTAIGRSISLSRYEDVYSDISDTYLILADLYLKEENPKKALQAALEGISLSTSASIETHYGALLEKTSQICAQNGDYANYIKYDTLYHQYAKRLYDQDKEYALAEIRAKYNLGEYENRISQQTITLLKRNRLLIILLFISAIAVACAITILYLWRKNSEYYKNVVRQYTQALALNDQIREMERENNKYNSSPLSETKGSDMFRKLSDAMSSEHLYRDSELTIERLASHIGSNRSYVSRTINQYAGMNFNQWVNKYRVEEAVRIITESQGECLLKNIPEQVGFNSSYSFQKAFAKETGISPSAFRNQCQ